MRLEDFRFRLTDKRTGASAVMSFDDLYGYEGETNGILVRYREGIPREMRGEEVSFNSGYGDLGLRPEWDIEVVEPGAANPIVEARCALDLLEEDFAADQATHCIAIAGDQRVADELNRRDRTTALVLDADGGPCCGFRPLNAWQVANFLHRASRGPCAAGRIIVAYPFPKTLLDGMGGVAEAVVAAAMGYYGQDDMPLWEQGGRGGPNPCVFSMLVGALGIDLPHGWLGERLIASRLRGRSGRSGQ